MGKENIMLQPHEAAWAGASVLALACSSVSPAVEHPSRRSGADDGEGKGNDGEEEEEEREGGEAVNGGQGRRGEGREKEGEGKGRGRYDGVLLWHSTPASLARCCESSRLWDVERAIEQGLITSLSRNVSVVNDDEKRWHNHHHHESNLSNRSIPSLSFPSSSTAWNWQH